MVQKAETAGDGTNPDRRRRTMEVSPDLDSRFLRVGNKLYRSPHDKEPMATITPDRIKAKDRESLPDLIHLAKENGWTSLRIDGDAEFKRAAFLAASAQGLTIDGYRPDAKTRAAADREQERRAGKSAAKGETARTPNQVRDSKEQPSAERDLAERFRRQSDVQNAKDPELKKAQSHVALAMVVAADRFRGDHTKQREFIAERKEEVAARIERGERVAGVEVKQKQDQQIRNLTQEVIFEKSRSIGGR